MAKKFADLDSDILLKDKLALEGGAGLNDSKRIRHLGRDRDSQLFDKLLADSLGKYTHNQTQLTIGEVKRYTVQLSTVAA